MINPREGHCLAAVGNSHIYAIGSRLYNTSKSCEVYSIENNCLSILDKLFCYSNSIFEKAKKMYNVETNHKIISSSKFKLLIDKKLNQ